MPLENLVDAILQSNELCCSLKKQVSEVYPEIYAEAHQTLVNSVADQKHEDEISSLLLRFPLTDFLKTALYQRIDRLALKAKKMAVAVAQEPDKSFLPHNKEQQATLTQLFNAILLTGRLARPDRKFTQLQSAEDVYHEYLMQLWQFICKNVERFDLNKSHVALDPGRSKFMIFVNASSHYLFLKAVANCIDKSLPSGSIKKEKNKKYQVISIDELPQDLEAPETEISLAEQLRELIEKDPQEIFSKTHLRNKPAANFREIALLSLQGLSMREISEKLGCPQQSLYTFYKRCTHQFIPIFQEYLEE